MQRQAPLSHIRVLVVDDDKNILGLTGQFVNKWGYETVICDSAEAALEKISQTPFNIILTDIKMGAMTGIALTQIVRKRFPSVAVIVMTGYPSAKTARESKELGAIYYLTKPFGAEDLSATLYTAAQWNIGKLVQKAIASHVLRHEKSNFNTSPENISKVKQMLLKKITLKDWMPHLRDLVYVKNFTSNPLISEIHDLLR